MKMKKFWAGGRKGRAPPLRSATGLHNGKVALPLLPPASKGWRSTVFTSVCLSMEVSHVHPIILPLVPLPYWGVPSEWSQVPSRGGYPNPSQGIPQSQVRVPQGTLLVRTGWCSPLPQPRYDEVPPSWPGLDGVHPHPPDRTTGVLATRQSVCLLRSRRSTVLFGC